MRIWDIEPEKLCRNHLLGEHRELHAIWVVLTEGKRGYACHPETLRWKGKLTALYLRHEQLVVEMKRRGYKHHSVVVPLSEKDIDIQAEYVDTYEEQIRILKRKGCDCKI